MPDNVNLVTGLGSSHAVATLIGTAASQALQGDAKGNVIAAFRRSFYVQTGSRRLACIGMKALGAGPLNVLIVGDWDAKMVPNQNTPIEVIGGHLVIGPLAIDLNRATPWQPSPVNWRSSAIGAAHHRIASLAAGRLPSEGLAPVVFTGVAEDAVARRAAPAIAALKDWLGSNDAAAPPEACVILVGLGPGLTPSGDDLISGVLITLRSLGQYAAANRLADWVLRLSDRTNNISQAHLAAAAAGEGSAALHATLSALATSDDPALSKSVDALTAIGHVSGWDALAGVALTLTVASNSLQPGGVGRSI